MQTFPTNSCRHYVFRNVQYVPVEQRQFQSIRIGFLTLQRLHDAFEDSIKPKKIGVSFPQEYPDVIFVIKHCVSIPTHTFLAMHPLEVYYLNQAGRGLTHSGDRSC